MVKYLSILIPSLTARKLKLNRLLFQLQTQILGKFEDDIEVITFVDNFENSIGSKRNKLLDEATGKFTCFIDDDDIISDRYCSEVLSAIKTRDDIQHVGFKVRVFLNGTETKPAIHSLKYRGWYHDHSAYYRQTTALNPILSSITKTVKFKEINYGEDCDWVNSVVSTGLLNSEYFIDDFMYFYYYNDKTSLSGDRRGTNSNNQNIPWDEKEISLNIKNITI